MSRKKRRRLIKKRKKAAKRNQRQAEFRANAKKRRGGNCEVPSGNDLGKVTELVTETIRRIPGQKIVTLTSSISRTPWVIDVSKDGVFGYELGHQLIWQLKLARALRKGCALVVRQFLKETCIHEGRTLPKKIVYMAYFTSSGYRVLPSAQAKMCATRCPKTGRRLPPEPGVTYGDMSRFLTAAMNAIRIVRCGEEGKENGKEE